jgi:hypothetical protein
MKNCRNLCVNSFILLAISIMTIGCASSKLELELSIYKDDPTYKGIITQADLIPAEKYLTNTQINLRSVVEIKKELADDLYNAFKTYWNEEGRSVALRKGISYDDTVQAKHMSALSDLEKQHDSYKLELDRLAKNIESYIFLAKKSGERLKEVLPKNTSEIEPLLMNYATKANVNRLKQDYIIILQDVNRSFKSLIFVKDDPFLISLKDRWQYLSKRVASDQFKEHFVDDSSFKKIKDEIEAVAKQILNTDSAVLQVNQQLEKQLDFALKQGSLETLTATLAENPIIYELSAEEESKRLQAFSMLTSQLERLQNPGSPVWRIVTDPENEKNWNTEFSRTYFYSEGNSGVVVVRDSPMDYRVQEGANNPAALVQAQLQVARAVADAAIQIAGASTGVPLVGATLNNQTISKADKIKYDEETESLVQKKAELEARIERRALSILSMTANLQSTLKQIKDLNPSIPAEKTKIENLRDDLVTSLKSQKSYFSAD